MFTISCILFFSANLYIISVLLYMSTYFVIRLYISINFSSFTFLCSCFAISKISFSFSVFCPPLVIHLCVCVCLCKCMFQLSFVSLNKFSPPLQTAATHYDDAVTFSAAQQQSDSLNHLGKMILPGQGARLELIKLSPLQT